MAKQLDFETEHFRSLLSENRRLLSDIADRRADVAKTVEIEFVCGFPDKLMATQARTEMRKHVDLPDGGLYIIADYSRKQGHCNLLVCVPMVPEPYAITVLEARLLHVAELFHGSFSRREFAASNQRSER